MRRGDRSGVPGLRSAGRRVTPERMARIVDVALDISVESGFAAVTVQSVAQRAHYVRPVVYDCYGTADNVLAAVVARERRVLVDELEQASSGEGVDPVDRFVAYVEIVASHPRSWKFFTLPTEGADESIRTAVAEFRADCLGDIEQWLVDATAATPGVLDHEALAVFVLAAIDALGSRIAADPETFDAERIRTFAHAITRQLRAAS